MIAQSTAHGSPTHPLRSADWAWLAAGAAFLSIAAVVISQLTAIAIWPDLTAFEPLNSLPRSVLFTALPAFGATGVLAWLDRHRAQPERTFLRIAVVVLLVSIIPDYLVPSAGKTVLASTVAALLHGVAAAVTVTILLLGYRRARRAP